MTNAVHFHTVRVNAIYVLILIWHICLIKCGEKFDPLANRFDHRVPIPRPMGETLQSNSHE